MRAAILVLALSVFLLSGCVPTALGDSCRHREPREATVSTEGVSGVRIVARAGGLEVKGHADRPEVNVSGMACASTAAALESIRLVAERRGSLLWIEADIPNQSFQWQQRRLDFVIGLPDSLPVEIKDSSGDLVVRDVKSLRLEDSSGEIGIFGVLGRLEIEDRSGDLQVERIGGDVTIRDSSGDAEVREVGGSVSISDRSGDIEVYDVKGDFVVEHDGSGDVNYRNVGGQVRVPKRR